jgi:hypothetical protein
MAAEINYLLSFNLQTLRNYRRIMKPRLPRKVTASARINLNRFWNELEEFYNRYDERTDKPVIKLPDYTTDTYDHEREAAENSLNDYIEVSKQQPLPQPPTSSSNNNNIMGITKVLKPNNRTRLESGDVDIEVSSEDDEDNNEVFMANAGQNCPQPPRTLWNNLYNNPSISPPRTLLDLVHRLAM